MKKQLALLFLPGLLFFSSCIREGAATEQQPRAKNIILLIGDGMGPAQVYAAISASKDSLNFEKMPVSGFSKTFSLTDYITDSAAGGTAIATGKKTKNGTIGQDTTGLEFKSILEIAEENGLSTGLVSTSSITHATPASFVAHVPDRNLYEDIALDFLDSGVDVFIGGGYRHFAARKDKLNLIDSLKARSYRVVQNMEEVKAISEGKLAGLVADVHVSSVLNGRKNMLPEATEKAIELLSADEEGFFLMIEASQIDWGGHNNNMDYVLTETIDMDKALGKALDFARADGNTLVIVTADHETGGITLTGGNKDAHEVSASFSTGGHTAVMAPVFAFGPGAGEFTGIMDNTEIFDKMLRIYNFEQVE